MKFYEVTNQVGGEDIWLRRIASLYDQVPTLIWPKDKPPLIAANSMWNRFLLKFSLLVEHLIPNVGRGLFLNFLLAFYKLDDQIIFLSTTYIPIPRGRHIIAYVHTPSRTMTIDYHSTRESYGQRSVISQFLLSILRFAYKVVYKFSLSHAKILLVNSLNVQKRLLDFVNVKADLCYPSQDTGSFYSREPENYFLLVSKIQPYKGHDFCLRAFKIFYEQNKDFRLVIISVSPKTTEEMTYFKKINSYVSENRLPIEFKFDLERNDVIDLYSRAYLCIFCSRNEDLGQVPIEAMASSKPVVSVRGPGPSETITDNVTGFLVDNEVEMADKMLQLVNNQLLASQMGRNGREKALNVFDDLRFKECLDRQLRRI
jgi:glycosyltransferase involved in cell wall biosynthesis